MNTNEIKRLEIWMSDYSGVKGCEQGGNERPIIIVSNSICCKYSPVITVAPITSKLNKKRLPTHVSLPSSEYNLPMDSFAMFEQLRSIDRSRLMFKITEIDENDPIVIQINNAMMIQLGLIELPKPQPRTQQAPKRTFVPPVPIPVQQPMVAFA